MKKQYQQSGNCLAGVSLNPQNSHMSTALEFANRAMIELMKKGITVLSLHLEHTHPLIQIMPCKACKNLKGAVTYIKHGKEINRAAINQCIVQWNNHKLH